MWLPQVKEHVVVEAHPDNQGPDLRLDQLWPALQEWLDGQVLILQPYILIFQLHFLLLQFHLRCTEVARFYTGMLGKTGISVKYLF